MDTDTPHAQYWPSDDRYAPRMGMDLEFRAELAFRLVSHWGSVAGKSGTVGSDGKAYGIELQTNEEFVARCFAIADLFTNTAESRGEIRAFVGRKE